MGAGLRALKVHDWPGNIRELQNFIERAVIMTTGPVQPPPIELVPFEQAVDAYQRVAAGQAKTKLVLSFD